MAAGKLAVSIIEARNVLADTIAEPCFYVKLKLGASEVRTDVVRSNDSPKFLKDVRLGVPSPEADVLRIELLQAGPRGDLVVGSDELRILSIANRGTLVHWFELKTPAKVVGAELCLVLRFLSAGANRPMSPSYAIMARQARDRAMEPPAPAPASKGLAPSKLQDLPPAPAPAPVAPPPPAPAAAAAPLAAPSTPANAGAPATTFFSSTAPTTPTKSTPLQQAAAAAPAPGPVRTSSPAPSPAYAPATPDTAAVASVASSSPAPAELPSASPATQEAARPSPAAGRLDFSAAEPAPESLPQALEPLHQQHQEAAPPARAPAAPTPAAAPASASASASAVAASHDSKRRSGGRPPKQQPAAQVPLPLAVLGGALVGAVVWLWKKRPIYYEVQEGDTLCSIGSCFHRSDNDLFKRNLDLLADPDLIYPGDRIRVR